jgi:hypothetical protein
MASHRGTGARCRIAPRSAGAQTLAARASACALEVIDALVRLHNAGRSMHSAQARSARPATSRRSRISRRC